MSVSNQTDKTYGSGNGATTTFSFPFKIFDTTQLVVYTIVTATGVVTGPLILNTDYTAAISTTTEGGTVTFIVAPPVGTTWFIKRTVPYTQAAVIPSEGTLPGKQMENQLDLMTMMIIQGQEAISRTAQLAITSLISSVTLPDPVDGYALAWSGTAGLMTNYPINAAAIATAIASTTASAATASAASSSASASAIAAAASAASIPTKSTDGTFAANSDALIPSQKAAKTYVDAKTYFVDRGDPSGGDFNAASYTKDGAFHDLDLSSIVPAGAKAVLMRIYFKSDTVGVQLIFRKKGNANTFNISSVFVQVANTFIGYDLVVPCSTARVIQYNVSASGTWANIDTVVGGWWL